MATKFILTLDLARKLIAEQFPEYAGLPITDVEKQHTCLGTLESNI